MTESEATASNVQMLLLGNNLDSSIEKELRKMCHLLDCLKMTFSACGVFSFNLPFFCQVLGSLISSIVVICQIK